nr:MAG: RNA-dependent RNA polymerase [Botourmiaviridae sp.]
MTMSKVDHCAAVYPASEGCSTFLHSVRSATIRAVSFLEEFYKIEAYVVVPPVSGSCTHYTSKLKKELDKCLISSMGGKFPQGVCKERYLSFAASISSVQKSWPDSCDCMGSELEIALRNRLTKEKVPLPKGYLEFVKKKVLELFPKGMRDRDLRIHSKRVTPPYTSTTTSSRKEGGSYSSWRGCREEYLNMEKPVVVHEPQFMVASTPGKPRPLVKNHHSYLRLRPVHTFMYDRISTQPWLLRGPPTMKKFLSAGFKKQKKYLSADFSAATDNISIEVAECVIDVIASRSSPAVIPILSEVRKSLRPTISMSKDTLEPTTGQLMGNLCSFPLLCLQNYFAAEWVDFVSNESTAKLINGDDLVVEASEQWRKRYEFWAPLLGFCLNEKKTTYSTGPNINSTYFTSNFKEIPFVRAKGLWVSDPRQIGKLINDIKRPFERTRHSSLPRLIYLLTNFFHKMIRRYGLTLYVLGFRVRSARDLKMTRNVKHYEKYRNGHSYKLREPDPDGMRLMMAPVEDVYDIHDDREISEAVVNEHWNGPVFERKKERLWEVKKKLYEDKKFRGRRFKRKGMRYTLNRFAERPDNKKIVWLPVKLADCYDLSHDRSSLDSAGFITYTTCTVCERVGEILRLRKLARAVPDWRLDLNIKYSADLETVQIEERKLLNRVDQVVGAMRLARS